MQHQFFPFEFSIWAYSALVFIYALAVFYSVNQGVRKNLAFLICSGLYFLYEVFVPVFDSLKGIQTFFGYSILGNSDLQWEVLAVYLVGISGFFLAWFFGNKRLNTFSQSVNHRAIPTENLYIAILLYQVVIWILVGFNISKSGVSLLSILDIRNHSEKDIIFSINWYSHGIDLLSNSLSVALFLQYWLKRKADGLWWLFFSIWLIFCLLAGWRYRIILLFLFFTVYFIREGKWSMKAIIAFSIAIMLSVSWLTLNRMAIAKRQFHLITFNLLEFDSEIFTMELSNSRTFKASLINMKEKQLERGGLTSWTTYGLNKFKAKKTFETGARPVPWIIGATKDWVPPGWLWNPNPAVNQMEEFYLTFGWIGMIIGMVLMGFWVVLLNFSRFPLWVFPLQIIGIGLCFQWISRGFFLYQAQITLACLIPFLVLYLVARYLPQSNASNPT